MVSDEAIESRRKDPRVRPSCLVTAYWANVYFGLRQAIEIDSLSAAIQEVSGGPAEESRRVHYLSALLHAASVSTSGTSHFAQPRHLTKTSELAAMARRRGRSVLETFAGMSTRILAAVLETPHAKGNRAFRGDWAALLAPERKLPSAPDLIYFDPPYTADNYSRFYHVLDVLARYDYPPLEKDASGKPVRGRYPAIETRFQSGFTRAAGVEDEFRRVIAASAATGAKLVISYSSPTGLLLKQYAKRGSKDPVKDLERLCLEQYREVSTKRHPMVHSGQGDTNIPVEELVVLCRRPR
jgi:adenine-specific DNA-methyltransferase